MFMRVIQEILETKFSGGAAAGAVPLLESSGSLSPHDLPQICLDPINIALHNTKPFYQSSSFSLPTTSTNIPPF